MPDIFIELIWPDAMKLISTTLPVDGDLSFQICQNLLKTRLGQNGWINNDVPLNGNPYPPFRKAEWKAGTQDKTVFLVLSTSGESKRYQFVDRTISWDDRKEELPGEAAFRTAFQMNGKRGHPWFVIFDFDSASRRNFC